MPASARDYSDLLLSGRWFQALRPEFQDALLGAAQVRELLAKERLFSRGDAPNGLYATIDGAITVTGVGISGKEAVLAVVEPPQWFGEIAVFDGLARTHDATAAIDSTVLQVSSTSLDAMLSQNPAWWRELGLLVTAKLRLAFVMMEDTALLPLVPRLARRLVLMAEAHGEWTQRSRRVLRLSQELLAAMVSSSRQTTNQALKELESRGLVRLSYGEIELIDLDALRCAGG